MSLYQSEKKENNNSNNNKTTRRKRKSGRRRRHDTTKEEGKKESKNKQKTNKKPEKSVWCRPSALEHYSPIKQRAMDFTVSNYNVYRSLLGFWN